MKKSAFEKIQEIHSKLDFSKKDLLEMLNEQSITISDYNNFVINLIENDSKSKKSLNISNFADNEILKDLENNNKENLELYDSENILKNLETFYSIDNCPSYLYNKALLENEDFEAFLEIYSEMFSLEKKTDKESVNFLKNSLIDYIKRIMESMSDDLSLEAFQKKFEKYL
jgi:hypothetical protein